MIHIGIIGTGKHGSRYANHIVHDLAGMNLTAICRRSDTGRQQANDWQCRYYQQWNDLIHDAEVDAVISVVPPALNQDIAKACAAAGKPLLLEKPLAVSLEAGAEIVSGFANAGLGLTVGQTLRYNPMIRTARENIGKIGTIRSIVAQHQLEPSDLPWLQDPCQAGAGVILHTAVHVFDALKYITGLQVARVRAAGYKYGNRGVEDLVSVNLEFENGAAGLVQSGKVCPARYGGYQFFGENGLLAGDQIYNELEIVHGTTRRAITPHIGFLPIQQLLIHWLAFLEGRGENPIPGEAGFDALKICVACLKSMRKGDWVEV
jgi:predicted dehydrogenase